MDSTLTEIKELQNPNVFITSVTFNDGTILPLPHNSIVVFTGANNSGKSQALKDVEHLFNTQWNVKPTVVSKVDREFWGEFNTGYMDSHFYKNAKGGFSMYESRSYNYSSDSIISGWKNKQLAGDLYKLFIRLINTEARLTSSRALHRTNDSDGHPIFKLCKSEELAQAISDYFKEAFGFDLVVNRNEMTNIPLCVGNAPNKKEYTMDQHDAYYDVINKMSRLDEQGDGMRSFASILLNTFTSEHTITLIDEPEAFLHPPQARLLGKMLATHNQNARQLFVATHSNDFLQGLLDAKNDNVIVIRINRVGNTNHMSILDHTKIRELWKNPILRYSNILSGLFHEKVVICESDYDCLFYQAIMDAIYENKNEIAPDILFTYCGGKQRIETVVKALRAVNVPVIAIADIDILDNETILQRTTEAFGMTWGSISTHLKKITDYAKDQRHQLVNSDVKIKLTEIANNLPSNTQSLSNSVADEIKAVLKQSSAWTKIKETGKTFFKGEEYSAWQAMDEQFSEIGLFIVPVGEIESFYKPAGGHGSKWWENVVQSSVNFATDSELSAARKFVQAIADF